MRQVQFVRQADDLVRAVPVLDSHVLRGLRIMPVQLVAKCGNCKFWDKATYPRNPRFGRCNFEIPPLPIWAAREASGVFRPMDREIEYCQTWTARETGTEP